MSLPHPQPAQPCTCPPPPYPVPHLRDPWLWYPDGNVVLVAQGVAFRVHCGVLARHSYVFKSWFSSPAIQGSEWLDGVPIVRLRPVDTAHDLQQALLAMYGLLPLYEPTRLNFSTVAGLRRFALAYGMADLVDATRYLLSPTFPSSLAEWDDPPARRLSFDLGPHQAIEAYNLAKQADDGHIFAAIYLCAQLPDAVLRTGTRRADGTPEALPDADLQLVQSAQARLRALGATIMIHDNFPSLFLVGIFAKRWYYARGDA
ncbi:hypothetical protein FKP32DRAFT_1606438 [Trametes sanguinea]|nr:hypothetical protein FKP32DRAFT_1606438 [Trametes sanguinea]